MGFSESFDQAIARPSPLVRRFRRMLAPASDTGLEEMARESQALTRKFFGKTVRLFAPLYLSNECINSCAYCGFSRENAILRVTLEIEQVQAEARHLAAEGFRNILLVAGEHPKFVSNGYLDRCIGALADEIPSVSIEVAPMEEEEYRPLAAAGAEGVVVYQETYDRAIYKEVHLAGPKKNFDWRLDAPERAHAAGFRRIGVGALFGLSDWRDEATALAAHIEYLLKTCWKSQLTVSLPRLRPAAGGFHPEHELSDRHFVQLICALRICFPHIGIVLSTREPAELRDAVVPLGITLMSAGSHTEPGGYTHVGKENLHVTIRGKTIEVEQGAEATGQFEIADERSPAEVANRLLQLGIEPVWKDWDRAILLT